MAYEHILLDVSPEGTAVLTLNRPAKRNALNAEVIAELTDAFEILSKNPECRLVLLRGNGPVFSAGADLEWMKAAQHYSSGENEEDAYGMAEMLRRLFELPQVTIALLHGAAMAGACGIAAACDIAIAKRGTVFACSEVKLGIIPATISPYIVNAIGPRWARTLFVTGERFEADVAARLGLINHEVEDEMALGAVGPQAQLVALQQRGQRGMVETLQVFQPGEKAGDLRRGGGKPVEFGVGRGFESGHAQTGKS